VWLDLVGLKIDLAASDEATVAMLREAWSEFVVATPVGRADIQLRAIADESVIDETGPVPEPEVRRSGARWELVRRDFAATWDTDTSVVELRYAATIHSFSSFLRVLLSIVLRGHGGILLHAASVMAEGGVFLFPGVSGTGKSTVAGLGAPRGVLSDEISAIRPTAEGGVRAFPTPFWGDLVRTRAADAAPLARIVLLTRGVKAPSIAPAPRAEASAALLEGALYFDELSAAEKRVFVAAIHELAARVPCYRLRFDLPANPWTLLDP
jgi:hypothetical protein